MTEADFGSSLADNVYRRFISKSGTGFGGFADHGTEILNSFLTDR